MFNVKVNRQIILLQLKCTNKKTTNEYTKKSVLLIFHFISLISSKEVTLCQINEIVSTETMKIHVFLENGMFKPIF